VKRKKLETNQLAPSSDASGQTPNGRSIEQQVHAHFQVTSRPHRHFFALGLLFFSVFSASGFARGILRRNNFKTLALRFYASRIAKLILLISQP
jgi:hypothetical protein